MFSAFKFGGIEGFFGVDTVNFMRCRDGARAIRDPVVSDIPVTDVSSKCV